jgi:Lysyl oxidase/CARDB
VTTRCTSTSRRLGNAAATTLITGLQAGYTDVYEPEVANQWVDVTGLPAGRYRLSISVDPENVVRESDEANNVVTWDLTLPMVTHALARQRLNIKRVAIVANGRAKTVAYATLSHRSVVTGTVFKMRGNRAMRVRDMKPRRYAHGAARIAWNQRDDKGRLMGRGLYKIKLVARTKRGVSQPEYMTFAITRKRGR